MNYINKIQDYLRLNHPTLWNLKVVPALLLAACGNLFMFTLGYATTYISQAYQDYGDHFSYHTYDEDPGIVYFFAFILALLSFILWLVFYFRNNRVKRFYPMNIKGLYVEWLFSFLIVSSFCLYPFSVQQGSMAKKRSYMTEQEMTKGRDFLYRVAILNPSKVYYLPDDLRNKISEGGHNASSYGSLLGFRDYYDGIDSLFVSTKEMLVKEDSVGIRALMEEYAVFQKKIVPESDLINVDKWMDIVYDPPLYVINRDSKEVSQFSKELYIDAIQRYYRVVEKGYNNDELPYSLLVTLFFGLSISMTVFGCRLTSGRSWLIALVFHFVVLLFTALIQFIISGELFIYLLLWISIYGGYIIYVFSFTTNRGHKGKTPMLMNLIITYTSVLLLFVYGIIYSIADEIREYHYVQAYYTKDGLYNFLSTWNLVFLWLALLGTIPLMYIVVKLALKWKAVPEE